MTATLDQLREEYDRLTMQAEVSALQKLVQGEQLASRLVESDQWGDLVNRREYLFDTPGWGRGQYDYRITSPDDRKRGKCTPFFENEQDLANIRGIGRYLATATDVALGAIETLINYTIGNGFTYEAEPLDEKNPNEPLTKAVQTALDEILEANHWEGEQEAEAFWRVPRDGEAILWVQDEGGMPLVRTIEPDYLTEPASTSRLEDYLGTGGYDWSFGIATMPGRHDRPYGYFVQWEGSASDWDVAPAHEVVHIKANVDRGVKRGISDFYGPYLTIERAGKLLGNTLQGAAIQATIAYIREHASGTTSDQIQSFRNSKATHTAQVPLQAGGTRTVYGEKFSGGRVIDTLGQKYHAGPLGQPAHRLYVEVMQAALRIVGARWSMPEYMISGDASNANYASTLVSGSPFVRATERRQGKFKGEFSRLMWIALGHLTRRRRFRQFGIHTILELKQQVQLKVEAPAVAIENKVDEEIVRKIRKEAHILSGRTWAGQVGLDYDIEQANILEEPQPILPMPGQPGQPGGQQPQQGQGDDPAGIGRPQRSADGGARPDLRRSAVAAALESGQPAAQANAGPKKSLWESVGDCGANAPGGGGFQHGNDCAGEGGGGVASKTKTTQRGQQVLSELLSKVKEIGGKTVKVPDASAPDFDKRQWNVDRFGGASYGFRTSGGTGYQILVSYDESFGNADVDSHYLQFVDEKEGFKITGAGKAHEVFSSVVPAVVSYAQIKKPTVMSFTAAEPSRQRLYDRLVKTSISVMPEYQAAMRDSHKGREYIVFRRDASEKLKLAGLATMSESVGPAWIPISPEFDETWATPDGWDEDDEQCDDCENKEPTPARQSAVAAALESVRTTDEARAIIESLKE